MDTLTILILEDDFDECTALERYACKFDDIAIVSITNSAEDAVEDIRRLSPRAAIIDLELHEGRGSGLDVIRELYSDTDIKHRPYILVTTNNTSVITYDYAREHGADYIISKHQENYSEKTPIDFLLKMKNIILNSSFGDLFYNEESRNQRTKRIRRRIITELNRIGINPKNVGYQYLLEVIYSAIENPAENAFQTIAEKRKISHKRVVRSIENTIKRAWRTTSFEDLYRNYTANITSESGFPTITEFIYYYANKISSESIHTNDK